MFDPEKPETAHFDRLYHWKEKIVQEFSLNALKIEGSTCPSSEMLRNLSVFVLNISAMLPSTRGYLYALAGQNVSKVMAKTVPIRLFFVTRDIEPIAHSIDHFKMRCNDISFISSF